MTVSKDKIGFIGLGIMGAPMADNLIKAGYNLVVYNRTKSKADDLIKLGAELGDSPSDVAKKCKYVITMLTDSPDVQQVILGESGVLEGIQPGSIVIDMSTISPTVTKEINQRYGMQYCF